MNVHFTRADSPLKSPRAQGRLPHFSEIVRRIDSTVEYRWTLLTAFRTGGFLGALPTPPTGRATRMPSGPQPPHARGALSRRKLLAIAVATVAAPATITLT